MADIEYTKKSSYTLPAWSWVMRFIDGIYIDGLLFESNIPVANTLLHVSVKPRDWHMVHHEINFTVNPVIGGAVSYITRSNSWAPFTSGEWNFAIDYAGNPYGMGLNLIFVGAFVAVPISAPVVYDVEYLMEVYL
jgi:hypothetical protein